MREKEVERKIKVLKYSAIFLLFWTNLLRYCKWFPEFLSTQPLDIILKIVFRFFSLFLVQRAFHAALKTKPNTTLC